jgi:aconitase B
MEKACGKEKGNNEPPPQTLQTLRTHLRLKILEIKKWGNGGKEVVREIISKREEKIEEKAGKEISNEFLRWHNIKELDEGIDEGNELYKQILEKLISLKVQVEERSKEIFFAYLSDD